MTRTFERATRNELTGRAGLHKWRNRRFWFGAALAIFLCVLLLRRVDFSAFSMALRNVPALSIMLQVLVVYLSIPLRALQWRLVLKSSQETALPGVTRALCLGYLGNAVLPTGAGEFLKAAVLSASAGLPLSVVFASILVVRVQDLGPLFALLTGSFCTLQATAPHLDETVRHVLQTTLLSFCTVGTCLVLGTLGVLLFPDRFTPHLLSLARRVFGVVAGSWEPRIRRFSLAMVRMRNPRGLWLAQVVSVACWLLFLLAPVPLLMGFGMSMGASLLSALALTGTVTVAQMLPLTPGGLGTYHAVSVLVLTAMNPQMPYETCLAYALVSHMVGTLAPALTGLIALPFVWNTVRLLSQGTSSFSVDDSQNDLCAYRDCKERKP